MIKLGLLEQIQAKVKACLEKTQGSTADVLKVKHEAKKQLSVRSENTGKYETPQQYKKPSATTILSETKDDKLSKVHFQAPQINTILCDNEEQGSPNVTGMQDYANKLLDYENISEEQLCNIFGLDKDKLRTSFQPIIKHICILFYFLKK